MRLLLDTHVVLWWLEEPERLSEAAHQAMGDPENRVFVSAASAWEIAIKPSLGKLTVNGDIEAALGRSGFEWLPIAENHAWATEALPQIHRDPFDRLLIAQAIVEEAILVTRDGNVPKYGVPTLLA
jgi:PIN domain nuclease of toxin-antitoxin system